MGIRSSVVLVVITLIAVGCKNQSKTATESNKPETAQQLHSVTLCQEWTANANFSGAALAASEFASDHHLSLRIQEGSENTPVTTLVASKRCDFGDAAADQVLAAIDKGVPLVIVGVVNVTSPTVFLGLTTHAIRQPKDFVGRRVGVLSGTATEYVYRAMLDAAQVDRRKIKEVEIGFDLQGFVSGAYDVRPAFAYDEPVSLERQGIRYTIIDPRDYGVRFVGTVYFTRLEMLNDSQFVQDVVSALADGWRLAIKDPNRAIRSLKKQYPTIDQERELESLKRAIPYVQNTNGRVLAASADDLFGTISALKKLKVINHDLRLDTVLQTKFIDTYYQTEVPR
jgi:NitT/TauT family transport system substrate-binding protein